MATMIELVNTEEAMVRIFEAGTDVMLSDIYRQKEICCPIS
jgi:hypothetical protein